MKKLVSLVVLSFILVINIFGQTELKEKGSFKCAEKKANSQNHPYILKSPNTPKHTFDVLNYSLRDRKSVV